MKIILYSVVFTFHLGIIKATEFLNLDSKCPLNEAVPKINNIVREEKSIRRFCNDYLSSENGKFYRKPTNCADVSRLGYTTSGVYTISPKSKEIQVYCDLETDDGGWTVFQRRGQFREPSINFTRSWTDYKQGFGNLFEEFWLGNENIHTLSSQDDVVLRVDLEDFSGNLRYAKYETFNVAGSKDFYKLTVTNFSGDAGDSFSAHNGLQFVTYDMNDANNCSKNYKGGWWYGNCHSSNLNGLNLKGKHESYANGINWYLWLGHHYSLKHTEMKLRPKTFQ